MVTTRRFKLTTKFWQEFRSQFKTKQNWTKEMLRFRAQCNYPPQTVCSIDLSLLCVAHTHNSMVHYMTHLLFMRKITIDLTSEIWRESILNRTHFTLNTIELKGNISKLPWSSQFLLYRSFSTFVFIHF